MKKILTLALVLALAVTGLSGCSGNGGTTSDKSPEELAQLYHTAITDNGGDDGSAMLLEMLGLDTGDMTAFGISASMMNVKAYAIAAVMPAEGKADAVKEGLQGYIDQQKSSFEMYLADQYEVAKNARLETLEDGTILMVMCEDQDTVFDAISAAIQAG